MGFTGYPGPTRVVKPLGPCLQNRRHATIDLPKVEIILSGLLSPWEASDITRAQLQRYVSQVESGELTLKLGPSIGF